MREIRVLPWQRRGNDCMRVGFSGSSGTGKTTLAKSVNEFLRFPYLEEGVREYLKRNDIEHLRDMTPKGTLKMHQVLLKNRRRAEDNAIKCVSDRTSYDNACYALYWLGRERDMQDMVQDYVMDCSIHAIQTYDVIFVLPMGVFPIEDDGCRSVLKAYQMGMQMMIEHSVQSGFPIHHVHQVQAESLEDRTAECIAVIDEMYAKKLENAVPPVDILAAVEPKKKGLIIH